MASIKIHDTPVIHMSVFTTSDDRNLILSNAKLLGITITQLAQELGITRPYIYRCFKSGFEISKFLKLQSILDLKLVHSSDVIQASNDLLDQVCKHAYV